MGEVPARGQERELLWWEGRHQSPWHEEVPATPSGDTAQQRVPAGHYEMPKKKKKSIPFCNVIKRAFFFFLIRPTCYVLYMEEEQSMITVQSRASKFSPQQQYIHNPSS